MFSYLQGRRVNLQLLQESACRELVHLLEKIEGSKSIILDNHLLGSIGLIAAPKIFSDRGIKLLKLCNDTRLPRDVNNIIYIVRPLVKLMDEISKQVLKNDVKGRMFHIFFVPRRSCLCLKHLEQKGVYENFGRLEELSWNFYPIENDVISMECASVFRDVIIDGDTTALYQAAIGLVQLQRIYGRIPKIYGKGSMSQCVWERAKQLGAEEKLLSNVEKGTIDQIILLDRAIDLISAFATQLTYEGLLDEFFGIHQNQLSMPAELFTSGFENNSSPAHLAADKKTFVLNSSDNLYAELRNKNFNEIGKILARNAKEISAQTDASSQEKSVQAMKRLVDKLPALLAQKQSVSNNTTMAELIRKQLDSYKFSDDLAAEQEFMMCEDIDKPSSYIEDLIGKKSDLNNILRLISIQCAAASGLKEKVLNYYKRELAHVYGIEVLLKISNLEKARVLYTQTESRAYAVLRKTLKLTVDDVVEVNPKDISYVHSFYAPLSVRIVEQSLKPLGWQSLKSQINNFPGPTFEDFQAQLVGIGGRHSSTPSERSMLNIPRVVLVFIVGGCTFAEIAALRFLAQQEDYNVEIVLNYYKRELAHVYGIEVLLKISNLEKARVLYTQTESRAYAVLRKTLKLTVDDVVEVNPKDISYVHSFYAPLSVRIVEQSLKPLGWQSLKSQINNFPGPTFEDFQAQLVGIGGRHSSTPSERSMLNIPRVVLVFIVGGCTFAEIAALRFLAQQEDYNVEIVIATTKIINKHTFLDSLIQ